MEKRSISPNGWSYDADDKSALVGTQDAFGPIISAGDIKKDGISPRQIEEIRSDIDLCLACLESRNICNRHCHECAYLPYDEKFPALAQENYIAYLIRKKRETAIKGIPTDRLIEICNAEREKRCLVLSEPPGSGCE